MEKSTGKLPIVGAIIAAGVIIAGAILYTKSPTINNQQAGLNPTQQEEQANQQNNQNQNNGTTEVKNEATDQDHVLGDPNAPLTFILYSDIECPYCRQFHLTMQKLMDEYGKNGQLKWAYRPFPLTMLHPTAEIEAEATECAADLGGNEKFWQYLDYISTNSVPKTDTANELVKIAVKLGLDEAKFKDCLTTGKFKQKIQNSIQDAASKGAQGTPYGILIGPKGETKIPGAYQYEQMKQIIDQQLK